MDWPCLWGGSGVKTHSRRSRPQLGARFRCQDQVAQVRRVKSPTEDADALHGHSISFLDSRPGEESGVTDNLRRSHPPMRLLLDCYYSHYRIIDEPPLLDATSAILECLFAGHWRKNDLP